jgi:hypothetical protein
MCVPMDGCLAMRHRQIVTIKLKALLGTHIAAGKHCLGV